MTTKRTTASEKRLLNAINSSASYVNAATITFLVTAAYILITSVRTTDVDLVLRKELSLPLVQVGVPIVGFYLVAPILLVLLHVNVLVQRYLLSRRFSVLRDHNGLSPRLGNQLVASVALAVFERPGNGPRGIRLLLFLLYVVGMMIFPAAILIEMQQKFLPYHSRWLTCTHQIALIVDLLIAGYCGALSEGHKVSWRDLLAARKDWPPGFKIAIGCFSIVAVLAISYSSLVLTIPGDFLDRVSWIRALREREHRDLDVEGADLVEQRPSPSILEKTEGDPDAESKAWLKSSQGIDLAGRHLEGANFSRAFISNANFSQAHLEGAKFVEAHVEGANFDPIYPRGLGTRGAGNSELPPVDRDLPSSRGSRTFVRDTDFRAAKLLGADLSAADFRGARLDGADLRHTKMVGTKLAESSFEGARLRFADLSEADLHGAQLQDADLLGATLVRSVLTGASLIGAQLQLADLTEAHLEAANVVDAHLEGAEMVDTILRGGDLRGSWLWGVKGFWSSMVDLRLAHLAGADLCTSTERGEPGPRDSDFRGVDFSGAPAAVWKRLEKELQKNTVQGRSAEILETRLDEASERELCVPSAVGFRRLLYDGGELPDPLAAWGQPSIDEEALYGGIVDWLVDEACENEALAKALEKRARHQVVPGNFVEERLLVQAMKARAADDPQCKKGEHWGELAEGD